MSVEKLTLKPNHTWKCRPGQAICVLDRGAVRFDFPRHWVADHQPGAVLLHDRKPSNESCDLGVSVFNVPGAAAAGLPLDDLVNSCKGDREAYERSEIFHIARGDDQIAWLEEKYIEATQKRDARFRVAVARGSAVHCLITMNYWASRAATLERVWNEVLRTLVLGEMVEDPASGPVVQ